MKKETKFKEVKINVTANGYTLFFSNHKGVYTTKDWFIARNLEDVKKLLIEQILEPKNY